MTGSRRENRERFGERYFREEFGVDELGRWSIPWWSVRFYVALCRRTLASVGGRRIVEAGCGQGWILAGLGDRVEAWGFDLSEYAIGRAREHAPHARFLEADLSAELPSEIPRRGFDLVLARYVLEHLHEPGEALLRLAELARPGGLVLYSVPDPDSPGRRMKGERWFAYQDPTHVSLLPASRWLELTRAAGLEPVKVFSDGLWDVPYWKGVPKWLQYGTLSLPTIVSVALTAPWIPQGWGENLIVIARREGGET